MSSEAGARPGEAGHGALVLVVGPSGAGKDTVLTLAAEHLRDDPTVTFCRRIVTRAKSGFEDHDTVDADGFARLRDAGAFELHWQAHGLSYGLPRLTTDRARHGGIVIANVSRTIIEAARVAFPRVAVVVITAPAEVLAARIEARGREAAIGDRISRAIEIEAPDLVIQNIGAPAEAAARLTDFVRGLRRTGAAG